MLYFIANYSSFRLTVVGEGGRAGLYAVALIQLQVVIAIMGYRARQHHHL